MLIFFLVRRAICGWTREDDDDDDDDDLGHRVIFDTRFLYSVRGDDTMKRIL